MSRMIADAVGRLVPDPWRQEVGFSPEINDVHRIMFKEGVSKDLVTQSLNGWLQRHQPCLFGRIAAKCNQLSYCILNTDDLDGDDDSIRGTIQEARSAWTASGFKGSKSGFVLLLAAERIASATPNAVMAELALRVSSLYLLESVSPDRVYLDEVFLEVPSTNRTAWAWNAGVNYFSAQGDRRWWHDHRMPGGMALSVNSVGHMVKSGLLARGMSDLAEAMNAPAEARELLKVNSLGEALVLAMRTIALASRSVSGNATWLIPASAAGDSKPRCPVDLPTALKGMDYCVYQGHYHTDFTIPTEYFVPDIERPESTRVHDLDFTYLFDDSLDNPDHITMGLGRKIRGIADEQRDGTDEALVELALRRRTRIAERQVAIRDHPRLAAAIGRLR